jgi:hypothetical protein
MDVMGVTPEDAIAHVSNTKDFPIEEFLGYCKKNGLRKGQAWMNALPPEDYRLLVDSRWDPFYADNWATICGAMVYLVDQNVDEKKLWGEILYAAGRAGDDEN